MYSRNERQEGYYREPQYSTGGSVRGNSNHQRSFAQPDYREREVTTQVEPVRYYEQFREYTPQRERAPLSMQPLPSYERMPSERYERRPSSVARIDNTYVPTQNYPQSRSNSRNQNYGTIVQRAPQPHYAPNPPLATQSEYGDAPRHHYSELRPYYGPPRHEIRREPYDDQGRISQLSNLPPSPRTFQTRSYLQREPYITPDQNLKLPTTFRQYSSNMENILSSTSQLSLDVDTNRTKNLIQGIEPKQDSQVTVSSKNLDKVGVLQNLYSITQEIASITLNKKEPVLKPEWDILLAKIATQQKLIDQLIVE
jgi:hypothetical protein